MSPSEASDLCRDLRPPREGEEHAPDFASVRSLKRELREDLRASWGSREPVAPEQVLPRWPGSPQDGDVASLLFEDYLQRQQHGEPASAADYSERFPSQA